MKHRLWYQYRLKDSLHFYCRRGYYWYFAHPRNCAKAKINSKFNHKVVDSGGFTKNGNTNGIYPKPLISEVKNSEPNHKSIQNLSIQVSRRSIFLFVTDLRNPETLLYRLWMKLGILLFLTILSMNPFLVNGDFLWLNG